MGRLVAAEARKGQTAAGTAVQKAQNADVPEDGGYRRKVAYIGVTKEDKAVGVSREDGFRSGLKSEGIMLEPDYVRTAEFTMDSGYHAALGLLEDKQDIRIISCATDTIAAGAIEAILAYSRQNVPHTVADSGTRMQYILNHSGIRVTGFGDNQFLKDCDGRNPYRSLRIQDERDSGSGTPSRCDRTGREDSRSDEAGLQAGRAERRMGKMTLWRHNVYC